MAKAHAQQVGWIGRVARPAFTVRVPSAYMHAGHDSREQDADEPAHVRRACDGDPRAFDWIIAYYAPRLFTHLYRMVGQREEAEDLVQEAFLRAYRYLSSYDHARPFRSWLYTIATHTAYDAIRLRKRGGVAVSIDDDREDAPRPEWESPLADGRAVAEREDLNNRLAAVVRRLSPQAAALVNMHYFEGMPIRDAGEACGMSETAAKVALHRARKQMRGWLVDREQ